MVLKLIGSILIVASCFSVGYLKSKKLYVRRDFLKSFLKFLSVLSTNIRYNSDDIFSLIDLSAKAEGLTCLENNNKDVINSFNEYWREKIISINSIYPLTNTDKMLLNEFGFQLGKTDLDGELKHIELYMALFEKQLTDAENAIQKKSKLYKAMGFFVGTATALMII